MGIGAKGRTTDAGTHVPLVANWKGTAPAGVVCDDLIDFTDFLSTLLDAVELEIPSGFVHDGLSFLPQIKGEEGNPRRWIFCHYDPKWGNRPKRRYVQNKKWKLYEDGRFFNLEVDILEKNPLDRNKLSRDVQKIIKEFEEVLANMR